MQMRVLLDMIDGGGENVLSAAGRGRG